MLLKNLLFGSSLAAIASAAPAPAPQTPATFGLIAIHSTSPVHNGGISASEGRLWINHKQNADCEKPYDFATFTVKDAALYLYNADATPLETQQFYVDRSGMGQGITGFTTGDDPFPSKAERDGFEVNNNHLEFDRNDFQACPVGDGSYTLWLSGVDKPAGIEGCIQVVLRTIPTDEPVSCVYTTQ
ncbi:hypothetical protein FQN54_009395 [Arachnomyces sp. PD_36]|nr:hypothetical protein FQN54_009395 [Arachnomyces sp. PD_36]